jgi:EAL domain-containing protein (putative c-di-GMP-specific phosphodiesterase class I)
VTQLDQQLEQYDLDPNLVCLEITEQVALRNPVQAISTMKRLRKLGVKLAMDDFGTGTTSLGYLRDLPLDYVKIDKSYIWKLRSEATSRLIIQFVVELGKEIGFSTVAEGVEDEELLFELQQLGVSIGQGYLVTRPKPFSARNDDWIFAESGQSRNIFGCVEAPS